jgi:uncharacterized protein (DUF1697 family)
MPQYIAFLRAINVGGHTIKMDALRKIFESLGLSNVETFIASGNEVFDSEMSEPRDLEIRIEKKLKDELGYETPAFIRTKPELAKIAVYKPFPQTAMEKAAALNIAFLKDKPDEQSKRKVLGLRTDIDDFHFHDREIYWVCLKKQSDSTFSNVVLEKTIDRQSTIRGISTIRKMAIKYSPTK